MFFKAFLTVFTTVLLAELGDKTQLATFLFATDKASSKLTVFLAASLALVVASAIAVTAGTLLAKYIHPKYLSWIAGAGFIMVGIWTIIKA